MEISIPQLIDDAKRALKSNAIFSALALTLSLVAECSEIEYPDRWFSANNSENPNNNEYMKDKFFYNYNLHGQYIAANRGHDRERFTMWIDDFYNNNNCDDSIKEAMEEYMEVSKDARQTEFGELPTLESGELWYQIRCKLFHTGSNDINFSRLNDEGNKKVKEFIYIINSLNEFDTGGASVYSIDNQQNSEMHIDIVTEISMLLNFVTIYYNKNKDTKTFNNIKIKDFENIYSTENRKDEIR